jgi:hypothetical protein
MDLRNQRGPKSKYPLLGAFESELEDGLTDSHRTVLPTHLFEDGRRPVSPPIYVEEPPTDPRAMLWPAPEKPKHPVVRRAERWLDRVGRWVGPRISNEEVGDGLERIARLARAGAPAWMLYAMMGATIFWVLAHGMQDFFLRRD